jgi:hypothetical protein
MNKQDLLNYDKEVTYKHINVCKEKVRQQHMLINKYKAKLRRMEAREE